MPSGSSAVYRAGHPVAITFRGAGLSVGLQGRVLWIFWVSAGSRLLASNDAVSKNPCRFRKYTGMSSSSLPKPADILPPRRGRRVAWLLGTLLLLILLTPRLITQTPLRTVLLSALVGKRDLLVQTGGASGGWLEPLSFTQVSLQHRRGSLDCTMGRLQTNLSLLQYLFSPPSSAAISATDVSLTVHIDEQGRWPTLDSDGASVERARWAVSRGTLVLTVPWRPQPLIRLQDLNVNGRIEPDQHGHRCLEIDACRLLDRTPLDDSHSVQNLALVAPVLSQTTSIGGSASLTLEALRIPLDGVEEFSPFPLRGTVILHELTARLTPQILQQVTAAVGRLPITLPAQITAPRNSRVPFEITEAGIQHTEMAFSFRGLSPALQIVTSGVLRLDETIRLQLQLRFGWLRLLKSPWDLLVRWVLQRFTLQAVGTVNSPELKPANAISAGRPENDN